jgi:hypothetical protein
VRRSDDDLLVAEANLEYYSITEQVTAEAAMQDTARRALSQYCSLFNGVAGGLDLKYYLCSSTDCIGGVIVSPVGEGNPKLTSMVNLVVVLNIELDHTLDELGKARAEIAELCVECAERRHPEDGSPPLLGLSTLTARYPVVIMLMAPLTAGPGQTWSPRSLESEFVINV